MEENSNFPIRLYPRVRGIEKVLETLGSDYVFHDSEVEDLYIRRDGTVRFHVWSGWSNVHGDKQYLTTWTLHDCISVDGEYDPHLCYLYEIRIEENLDRICMILDGVGPEILCGSIDVTIEEYSEMSQRVYFDNI